MISGLQSQPELNGTFGMVEGWDAANSRWKVRSEHDGKLKVLKPDEPPKLQGVYKQMLPMLTTPVIDSRMTGAKVLFSVLTFERDEGATKQKARQTRSADRSCEWECPGCIPEPVLGPFSSW